MKSLDIINIAGLLMNEKNDDLEYELRETLKPKNLTTIAPTPPSATTESPELAIERAISSTRGKSNIVLIGRSYGGFIALLTAIRTKFENIHKAIIIESPVHPDVTVKPPILLPPLLTCRSHYKARPKLAEEAAKWLKQNGTSGLVIIQGSDTDAVVPNEAQVIPGDFETIELSNSNIPEPRTTKGKIYRLPKKINGPTKGLSRILPENYNNHLSWSHEKITLIREIIDFTGSFKYNKEIIV